MGEATEKALSPLGLSLEYGTSRMRWVEDHSVLTGTCWCSSSDKYDGATLLKALKTSSKILKYILKLTGSQ